MAEFGERENVLEALAKEILHNYSRGRAVIGVDGVDGAGKTRFADGLGGMLARQGHPIYRASIDGFHRPRIDRYGRGRNSPEGFYLDSYDYDQFRRLLVEPFRLGAPFTTAVFDEVTDSAILIERKVAPPDALLVVDGIFLNRPELRGLWNFSIWLVVSPDVAAARMMERDGITSVKQRYSDGQQLYIAEANPLEAATAVYENSDYNEPKRLFLDRC